MADKVVCFAPSITSCPGEMQSGRRAGFDCRWGFDRSWEGCAGRKSGEEGGAEVQGAGMGFLTAGVGEPERRRRGGEGQRSVSEVEETLVQALVLGSEPWGGLCLQDELFASCCVLGPQSVGNRPSLNIYGVRVWLLGGIWGWGHFPLSTMVFYFLFLKIFKTLFLAALAEQRLQAHGPQ